MILANSTLPEHTAHDPESTFAPTLIKFVREIATQPQTQHIKVIGVCFGHQIISLALGGKCVRGDNGWEVGVYGATPTPEGRYWWSDSICQNGQEKIVSMHQYSSAYTPQYTEQMHKDNVPETPPGCQLLLSTPRYPIHSFVKLHPDSTPENPLARVLTIQGHPEFTPGIVTEMVNVRSSQGIFDDETTVEARRRLPGKDGQGGEGVGRVGSAIWRVMLQDLPAK